MLKKISTFCALFLASTSALFFLSSPASALEAGDIVPQINPSEQSFNLVPGETATGSLKVKNIGRLEFSFTLSARPYQVTNDDYDPDFSTENDFTKLYNWLSFPETSYHLAPGEEVEVKFTADVPSDAPGGGQYAAIIVETRDSIDPNASVRVINQLAALLYGHVDGEIWLGGEVVENSLPNFLLGAPFFSTVTIENTGNIDFRFTHSFTIYDFFTGNEVFSPNSIGEDGLFIGSANPLVLPGTTRTNTLTWEGAPQLGVFRAVQTIDLLEETITNEQLVIICPVWLAVGAGIMVILMLLWLIIRIKNRKHRRPQAF